MTAFYRLSMGLGLVLWTLLQTQCVVQSPKFIRIHSTKIDSVAQKNIYFHSKLVFYNPNGMGLKAQTDSLVVIYKDLPVGKVAFNPTSIHKKQTFEIPLQGIIYQDQFFKRSSHLLSGALGYLFGQELQIQIQGLVKFKILGIGYRYKVNETVSVEK